MPLSVAKVQLTAVASSGPIQIFAPGQASPWTGAGLLVNFSSGASATAHVEVSGDGAIWNAHDSLHDLTASTNGNLAFPVAWVRLRLSVHSSGTVTLSVIEVVL